MVSSEAPTQRDTVGISAKRIADRTTPSAASTRVSMVISRLASSLRPSPISLASSALAPLLVSGYAKVTLVDIRYIQSAMLGQFLSIDDQDVLFLYSTLVLNSSSGLR